MKKNLTTHQMEIEFWKFLEELLNSSSIVIERSRNTSHPEYPGVLYPYDYGYLQDTISSDLSEIDVWVGEGSRKELSALICTVDLNKRDIEIKLLIGCSDSEIQKILEFHNSGSMRATLIQISVKEVIDELEQDSGFTSRSAER